MKRRILPGLIAFFLLGGLAACDGEENAATSVSSTSSESNDAGILSVNDMGADADPSEFTLAQYNEIEETSDLTLCLSWETGVIDDYLNRWLVISEVAPWDTNDEYMSVSTVYGINYYFKDQENYDQFIQECLIGNYTSGIVLGYFQEAGIDTYEAINCIYLGGETSNGESDINSQGGIEDAPHTGLITDEDSQYLPPQYEGDGRPLYLSSPDLDPHTITENDLQKYIAHITPKELNDLNGQSDFFIDDSWVLINNLQANLYYSYSSNSFHDIYQTTYTFMDGEDIYFFTNQGRAGAVLGYVTYDRGYYKVDNCIVYQIDSGTTSDDEVYEFTADEFSEIQIDDSVVSKYRDITLRITGVEVSNINTKEGSFRSNIQNRLVLLLDPREISNLTDGDIISIDCKIGFAMVRGYVFYDAVVVN